MRRSTTVLLLLLASAPSLAAQGWGSVWEETAFYAQSFGSNDDFGQSVSPAGDVDGDGRPDLQVTAPNACPPGGGTGTTWIVSNTGEVLCRFDGTPADVQRAPAGGVGDLDGDGRDDILLGEPGFDGGSAPAQGAVSAWSGATGALLWRVPGGTAWDGFGDVVAVVEDQDGDGIRDVLAGAPYGTTTSGRKAGYVYLLAGATGQALRQLEGQWDAQGFGFALAAGGDVDGDGRPDLLVGSWRSPQLISNTELAPAVTVYSGRTGHEIWTATGTPGSDFGLSLADAGDVDGDGRAEVLAGAPDSDVSGLSRAGAAYLLSGRDGSTLRVFTGTAELEFLGTSVAAGDLDGDGRSEFVIGVPRLGGTPGPGRVEIRAADDGRLLHAHAGRVAWDRMGVSVAYGGDWNGDGLADALAGASTGIVAGLANGGYADAIGLRPWLSPRVSRVSRSAVGAVAWTLHFGAQRAWHAYRILASASGTGPTLLRGLEVPLTPDPLYLRTLAGTWPGWVWGFDGVLDPEGEAAAIAAPPPGLVPPPTVGRAVYLAAVLLSPSGSLVQSSAPAILEIEA